MLTEREMAPLGYRPPLDAQPASPRGSRVLPLLRTCADTPSDSRVDFVNSRPWYPAEARGNPVHGFHQVVTHYAGGNAAQAVRDLTAQTGCDRFDDETVTYHRGGKQAALDRFPEVEAQFEACGEGKVEEYTVHGCAVVLAKGEMATAVTLRAFSAGAATAELRALVPHLVTALSRA